MTIAPNGVAIADYDPTGVGAIVFCVVSRSSYPNNIDFGEVVDAATVGLKVGGVCDQNTDPGNNVVPAATGTGSLSGQWKCLGYIYTGHTTITQAGAPFMRVS